MGTGVRARRLRGGPLPCVPRVQTGIRGGTDDVRNGLRLAQRIRALPRDGGPAEGTPQRRLAPDRRGSPPDRSDRVDTAVGLDTDLRVERRAVRVAAGRQRLAYPDHSRYIRHGG